MKLNTILKTIGTKWPLHFGVDIQILAGKFNLNRFFYLIITLFIHPFVVLMFFQKT